MDKIGIKNILLKIQEGDNSYFECLYSNYFKVMYGIAFSITKNESTSCDVIQNVMYKLYILPKEKFPQSNELSWLYSVTKNEALQILRKEKISYSIDEFENIQWDKSPIEDFIDMDAYYSMTKSLNEKQSKIVTLKVIGGLTHREISEILDMPIGTIQWIYNTSIAKLRVKFIGSLILSLVCGSSFAYNLYKDLNTSSGGDIGIESVPTVSSLTMLLGAIFLLSIVVSIVFYVKSKKNIKIPNKSS